MLYLECPKHIAIVCYLQPCQKFCLHVSEESRQIRSKARLDSFVHIYKGKAGHSHIPEHKKKSTNKTSVYHQPQHLWRNHNAAVYQAVLLKSQFFCWGEFNNKQVEWFGLSSKLYHHAKGKVKLQKSFCVAILFPISLFFDMKSMKTKLFTHFRSDQSHIAG